jgi:Cu-processing system ATP-binding protein
MGDQGDGRPLAVDAEALSKRYGGKLVLDTVTLQAKASEVLALIGHNGAGKTTLFKLILGLARPSSGTLTVLGQEPGNLAAAARGRFGFLPENVSFHSAMSGREVLHFYAKLKRVALREADALLDQVGMGRAADRKVQTYSKGMRQRLGLAQALLGEPELLLLDEPTTGLDPFLRRDLDEIVAGRKARGATVLMSTHTLSEIEERADRVAILTGGRLVACASVEELRDAAQLPVRIRITTAPGCAARVAETLGGDATLNKVNDHSVHLDCPSARKLSVITRIGMQSDDIEDIEIVPPRLEDVYTHFVERGNVQ